MADTFDRFGNKTRAARNLLDKQRRNDLLTNRERELIKLGYVFKCRELSDAAAKLAAELIRARYRKRFRWLACVVKVPMRSNEVGNGRWNVYAKRQTKK